MNTLVSNWRFRLSPLFAETQSWIPVSVLLASFAGSAHCLSMCGGLVATFAPTRSGYVAYHLGRLMGYSLLGSLAGFAGQSWIGSSHPAVSLASAIVLGLALLAGGLRAWSGRGAFHASILPNAWLQMLLRKSAGLPFLGGLASCVLPCGWLHTFVLGAAATQSPVSGGVFLAFFWLGTLPALSAAPWLLHKLIRPLEIKAPRVVGSFLILAGSLAIASKLNLGTSASVASVSESQSAYSGSCHPPSASHHDSRQWTSTH